LSASTLSSTFRLELYLLGSFVACWLAFFVSAAFDHPFAGVVPLGLYELYGTAVLVGWIVGNVFVHRSRGWSGSVRTRLLLVFLLSPGGLFYLLWSLSSDGHRAAVPFAPLYAFGMSALFLLVPVSFRRSFIGRK
jgi:hypothetical protein